MVIEIKMVIYKCNIAIMIHNLYLQDTKQGDDKE